jgi:hypothetical protein
MSSFPLDFMTAATTTSAPAPARHRFDDDRELREFRELMAPPDHWDDGFGLKAMIGGLFVGLIMTPASMYMSLVIGPNDMGPAAQWVTIILFIEVARRSFTVLSRPEIFVLYYMAGASMVSSSGLLWNQFLVNSESMRQFGLADKIPPWVAPNSPDVLGTRSFFNPAWYAPIGLMILGQFLQRVDNFGLGYVMYRLTSDVEKLPFPMAPVAAQGITALADASGGKETWRWRVFSFGAMLGMAFAVVYVALPSISSALLGESISIFPLPWKDLTSNTESFLPAVPMILSFNLGLLISGMVLPYGAMVGSFIGLVCCIIANPILYKTGVPAQLGAGDRRDHDDQQQHAGLLLQLRTGADGGDRGDRDLARREQLDASERGGRKQRLEGALPPAAGARGLFDLHRDRHLPVHDDGDDRDRVLPVAARAHGRFRQPDHQDADGGVHLLRLHLHADHQLRQRADGGDRRHDGDDPVREGSDVHPHRLQGRGHLVRAVPGAQLRGADAVLPQDRADGHEDHLDDQGRAVRVSRSSCWRRSCSASSSGGSRRCRAARFNTPIACGR